MFKIHQYGDNIVLSLFFLLTLLGPSLLLLFYGKSFGEKLIHKTHSNVSPFSPWFVKSFIFCTSLMEFTTWSLTFYPENGPNPQLYNEFIPIYHAPLYSHINHPSHQFFTYNHIFPPLNSFTSSLSHRPTFSRSFIYPCFAVQNKTQFWKGYTTLRVIFPTQLAQWNTLRN